MQARAVVAALTRGMTFSTIHASNDSVCASVSRAISALQNKGDDLEDEPSKAHLLMTIIELRRKGETNWEGEGRCVGLFIIFFPGRA